MLTRLNAISDPRTYDALCCVIGSAGIMKYSLPTSLFHVLHVMSGPRQRSGYVHRSPSTTAAWFKSRPRSSGLAA